MEYCNVSWSEGWEMSIEYRKWLIERKKKELEKKKEAEDKARGKVTPKAPPKPKATHPK